MKKEEIKDLIREYLTLKKKIDHLHEELRGVRNRFEKVGELALRNKADSLYNELKGLRRRFEEIGGLLYGYRSRDFLRSVIFCVVDLEGEYGKDEYYHNFLTSLISILRHFEEYDADRRKYGDLIQLPDEKVE
jgi:hypothetical protein